MSVEQKILCAVAQVDMFLVDCWKWMPVILVLFGLFILTTCASAGIEMI